MNFKGELSLMLTTRAQMTYFAYGDLERAKRYLDEAVAIGLDARLRWATTMSVFGMARLAGAMGDLDTARRKFLDSAETARRVGNKRLMYSCYSEMAHVLRENGELDEPLEIYRDLLPKWRDLGHRAAVAHELECIAYILSKKGQPERAVTILGAADRQRQMIGSTATPVELAEYENELSALRGKLLAAEFERAWEDGRNLEMEDAIALAVRRD
jgi:tetratricopeptide (TPR) repeat protein